MAQFPRATGCQPRPYNQALTLVESDLALLDVILTEADEDSVLSSLSSDYYGVTSVWSVKSGR
jgi:hypothetical protein